MKAKQSSLKEETYLGLEQVASLLVRILLPEHFNAFGLLHFEFFELLPVVHSLFNSFVNGHKRFIILHFFEPGVRLDICAFDCPIELLIQHVHLLLVLVLEVVHFHK